MNKKLKMDFRQQLFKYRSYIPIPFIIVMLIFSNPTIISVIVGIIIVGFGEFIRLWGVSYAGSETRTTGPVGGTYLITSGPFAYVRNPLYLGNMLIYLGFGVISLALFPWFPLAAFVYFLFQYSLIVSLEEEFLRLKFRDEYSRYYSAVPRFFPKLRKYSEGSSEQPKMDWIRGFKSEKRTLQAIIIVLVLLYIRGYLW